MDMMNEAGDDPGCRGHSDDSYGGLPILPQRPIAFEDREARIRQEAYRIALRRGLAPGHELDDWLQAERAVDAGLA